MVRLRSRKVVEPDNATSDNVTLSDGAPEQESNNASPDKGVEPKTPKSTSRRKATGAKSTRKKAKASRQPQVDQVSEADEAASDSTQKDLTRAREARVLVHQPQSGRRRTRSQSVDVDTHVVDKDQQQPEEDADKREENGTLSTPARRTRTSRAGRSAQSSPPRTQRKRTASQSNDAVNSAGDADQQEESDNVAREEEHAHSDSSSPKQLQTRTASQRTKRKQTSVADGNVVAEKQDYSPDGLSKNVQVGEAVEEPSDDDDDDDENDAPVEVSFSRSKEAAQAGMRDYRRMLAEAKRKRKEKIKAAKRRKKEQAADQIAADALPDDVLQQVATTLEQKQEDEQHAVNGSDDTAEKGQLSGSIGFQGTHTTFDDDDSEMDDNQHTDDVASAEAGDDIAIVRRQAGVSIAVVKEHAMALGMRRPSQAAVDFKTQKLAGVDHKRKAWIKPSTMRTAKRHSRGRRVGRGKRA